MCAVAALVGPETKLTVGATLVTETPYPLDVEELPARSVTVTDTEVLVAPSGKVHWNVPSSKPEPVVPGNVSEPATLVPAPQLPLVPVEAIPDSQVWSESHAQNVYVAVAPSWTLVGPDKNPPDGAAESS